MENINKFDELGRRQGIWIKYWGNGNIMWKLHWLDNRVVNHVQYFYYNNNYKFDNDLFYHRIF